MLQMYHITMYEGFICLSCGAPYLKEQDAWDCDCDETSYNFHEIAEQCIAKCNKCDTLYAHICEAYDCCKNKNKQMGEIDDYKFD